MKIFRTLNLPHQKASFGSTMQTAPSLRPASLGRQSSAYIGRVFPLDRYPDYSDISKNRDAKMFVVTPSTGEKPECRAFYLLGFIMRAAVHNVTRYFTCVQTPRENLLGQLGAKVSGSHWMLQRSPEREVLFLQPLLPANMEFSMLQDVGNGPIDWAQRYNVDFILLARGGAPILANLEDRLKEGHRLTLKQDASGWRKACLTTAKDELAAISTAVHVEETLQLADEGARTLKGIRKIAKPRLENTDATSDLDQILADSGQVNIEYGAGQFHFSTRMSDTSTTNGSEQTLTGALRRVGFATHLPV